MTKRKLVTIDQVVSTRPIEGADFIEMVQVRNWECVVKKEYNLKPGDLVVYAEIDSLFPMEPRWEFLSKNGVKSVEIGDRTYTGYRIRTMKFRGQIAQGLALPLSFFDEAEDLTKEVGTDITDLIGVVKWEAPPPESFEIMGPKPSFYPSSDQERIQNIPLSTLLDKRWYVTEKLDGTSVTYFNYDGRFGICTSGTELKPEVTNIYTNTAKKYDIEDIVPPGWAIQGEIVGPGIQKNRQCYGAKIFKLYSVFDILAGKYLDWYKYRLFSQLFKVPMIQVGLLTKDFTEISQYLELASRLGNNSEGVVLSRYAPNLSLGRESFKVINNNYLLKEK